MKLSILTVFSHLYDSFLQTSLIARAQEQKLVTISVDEFRSFVAPKERIDAPTIGHGAGMLIRPEVVEKAIESKEQQGRSYRIFFSPHGKKLTQKRLKNIAAKAQEYGHILLVAGRYEGMDVRVEQEYADEIISIGDFVVMGGDLPAMLFLEGFMRLLPGVVGKAESVQAESFSGPFVDYPEYTHPIVWHTMHVPEVLRSGNHQAIAQWRAQQAVLRTVRSHFEWLRSCSLNEAEKKLALTAIPHHYVALMHDEVIIQDTGKVGTTSVTSLDIHDIARSSKTFGIQQFFIVTPLIDQQKIVKTLLNFWQEGAGIEYNASRHQAVKQVELAATFEQVKQSIEQKEGKIPLTIATSAKSLAPANALSFYDQELIWSQDRPVLFIFGTGKGLSPALLKACDYVLDPIEGLSEYNHLSVRSAVAIILDRWLGLTLKNERD